MRVIFTPKKKKPLLLLALPGMFPGDEKPLKKYLDSLSKTWGPRHRAPTEKYTLFQD